jgi:hypothetical protein
MGLKIQWNSLKKISCLRSQDKKAPKFSLSLQLPC